MSTDRADAAAAARAWLNEDSKTYAVPSELRAFEVGAAWGQQRERDRMAGLLREGSLIVIAAAEMKLLHEPRDTCDWCSFEAALVEGEGRAP